MKVSVATGNWSTAGTWGTVTNTPTIHASTNITLSGSAQYTGTFTAPNTTNACEGVVLVHPAVGTAGTVTVTLQENSIDTATNVAVNIAGMVAGRTFYRFAAPYVFTSTTAGYYRFKVTIAGATGNTTVATESGGTTISFYAVDNRNVVPQATEDVCIIGSNNGTTVTVTMDGTQSHGSGTDTSTVTTRSVGNAFEIQNDGVFGFDTTATSQLTTLGNIAFSGNGYWNNSTTLSSSYTATWIQAQNGVAGRHGIAFAGTSRVNVKGTPKSSTTLWKTTYVSGTGTAASPLVTATSVDWVVGDEIQITSGTYSQSEKRFIITKNSATSYVVSTTKGGAEAAFTYAHATTDEILNLERNIVIKSDNTSHGFYLDNYITTAGNIVLEWVRFENVGNSGTAAKYGIYFEYQANTTASASYCVAYNILFGGFLWNLSTASTTYTGLIAADASNAGVYLAMYTVSCANKTYTDFRVVNCKYSGFGAASSRNLTITGLHAWDCGTNGTSNTGGIILASVFSSLLTDCESHASRLYGLFLNGAIDVRFIDYITGTKGNNTVDVSVLTASYNTCYFDNPTVGSTTLISNYLNQSAGSKVGFQRINATDYNNRWYTPGGSGRTTGAGLTDTTVRTTGNHNLGIYAEDATNGFIWEYKQLARVGQYAQCSGYIYENATFVAASDASVTVELFLPGSATADATKTMTKTTNEDSTDAIYNLAVAYTGTQPDYFTVRITVKTATASAYCYIADILQGSNNITGFNVWTDGQPSPIMFEQLGDPQSVWSVLASAQTDPNTLGYYMTDLNGFGAALALYVPSAVLDELLSSHVVAGSVGKAIADTKIFASDAASF